MADVMPDYGVSILKVKMDLAQLGASLAREKHALANHKVNIQRSEVNIAALEEAREKEQEKLDSLEAEHGPSED